MISILAGKFGTWSSMLSGADSALSLEFWPWPINQRINSNNRMVGRRTSMSKCSMTTRTSRHRLTARFYRAMF